MIALTFSGQGSHYKNMGQSLYQADQAARQVYDLAGKVLGYDLLDLSLDQLDQTSYAQPALVAFSLAIWSAWEHKNKETGQGPSQVGLAGFSLGEYSCLAAAGLLDLADLFWLVQKRAEFMARAADEIKGQMLAVLGLPDEQVCAILSEKPWHGRVFPVNFNAPGQLVVSGLAEVMPALSSRLQQAGARRLIPLRVSGAFHTPYMSGAASRLEDAAAQLSFRQPQGSLYSNLDGRPLSADLVWPAYLARHLCLPVRWHDLIRNMQADGADVFLEFGPGRVLTGLARKICPSARAINMDNHSS